MSVERQHIEKMKKYLNFIGPGVGRNAEESAQFLHRIRRASERAEFFGICAEFLEHDEAMPLVPFSPDAPVASAT